MHDPPYDFRPKNMRSPLRYQILIPFALVLLGVIGAISALNAVLATQRAKGQIEEQLQGIAATLADSSFPLTDMVLRQMHGLSGAEFVFTDAVGRSLATSSGLDLPAGDNATAVQQWQQLRLGPPVEIAGRRFFEMALAIPSRGQQPGGRLHILYPEKFWLEARSEAALPPLVVGVVALLITAGLALWLAGRLTHPILELRSQVSRIAQADYSPMPLPARDDELRDLAVAVNRMAGQLAEMERAIRRSERLALLGPTGRRPSASFAKQRNRRADGRATARPRVRCRSGKPRRRASPVGADRGKSKAVSRRRRNAPIMTPAMHRVACRLPDVIHEVVELLDPSLRHRRVQLSVLERATGHSRVRSRRCPIAAPADEFAAQCRRCRRPWRLGAD